jgi:hypothetical protein
MSSPMKRSLPLRINGVGVGSHFEKQANLVDVSTPGGNMEQRNTVVDSSCLAGINTQDRLNRLGSALLIEVTPQFLHLKRSITHGNFSDYLSFTGQAKVSGTDIESQAKVSGTDIVPLVSRNIGS